MDAKIYANGDLPNGETFVVIVFVVIVFDGKKPTLALDGKIQRPAFAIATKEGRKRPRITMLDRNAALGIAALVTYQLDGDRLDSPKVNSDKQAITDFLVKLEKLKTENPPRFKVLWGLR